MNSVVQMMLLAALATIALTLVLVGGEKISETKQTLNKAQLSKARATLENALFHVIYCGDYCQVDVELPNNITLYLENSTCLLFDSYGNSESCYFPLSTPTKEINNSKFRLVLKNTVLEVEGIG